MRMTLVKRRKQRYKTAVTLNLTIPPSLHEKLVEIINRKAFSGPSDYFQARIRLDSNLTLTSDQEKG
jgi:hypothetical protein